MIQVTIHLIMFNLSKAQFFMIVLSLKTMLMKSLIQLYYFTRIENKISKVSILFINIDVFPLLQLSEYIFFVKEMFCRFCDVSNFNLKQIRTGYCKLF